MRSISFSGGRSSAYMLHRLLQEWGGLPDDVKVCFANTGKEMPQTLDFVEECSQRWGVPITWLEYQSAIEPKDRWRITNYAEASREGEPFAALIKDKRYLPNPVTRFCTIELKIRPMKFYARSLGWENWTVLIGFRADEQRRIAKLSGPNSEPFEREAPMGAWGTTNADVTAFWQSQPFDLRLPNIDGKTKHGNCDLCFLKGAKQVASLIAEEPTRADWWMEQERLTAALVGKPTGTVFRSDRPNYAAMKYIALHQIDMVREHDESIECGVCID